MRKLLSLIFMLAGACSGILAEEYKPMLNEGKSWTVLHIHFVNVEERINYTVSGDTVVDGRACKRIIVEHPESNYRYATAAYEEDQKLYSYGLSEDGKPVLLLDFSKNVGDELFDGGDKVKSVDYITVNGVTRKRIIFDVRGGETACWVEGVGSNYDYWIGGFTKPTDGSVYYLLECRENGELVFSQSDFGVTMSIDDVRQDNKAKKDNARYSLGGVRLSSAANSPVYIQGGKKYVKR